MSAPEYLLGPEFAEAQTLAETRCPADFAARWSEEYARLAPKLTETQPREGLGAASCAAGEYRGAGGRNVPVKLLRPAQGEARCVVVDYHDAGRSARGFYYLARYLALGAAVLAPALPPLAAEGGVALQNEQGELLFKNVYLDALAACRLAVELYPGRPVYVCGEGLGGAMALAAAALEPAVKKCAVLNPLLADFRRVCACGADWGYYRSLRDWFRDFDPRHEKEQELFGRLDEVDCVNFAALVRCPLLLGTGLLDQQSPSAAQYGVYAAAKGPKRQLVYPKYGHERVNFYENEALNFLADGLE